MDKDSAKSFIMGWSDAWNRHDVEGIMSFFTDDVENITPLVKSMLGIESGTIKGKEAVTSYWKRIITEHPEIRITPIDHWCGVNVLTVRWIATSPASANKGSVGVDTFFFNPTGKVFRATTTHV